MKRVLILAYDFPPYASIAAQRPASWFRYFKKFGAQPVVITRHWDVELKNYIDCFRPSVSKNVETTENDHGAIVRVPYFQNIRDKMLTQQGERRNVFLRKAISFLLEILKFHFFYFDNRSGIYREARKILAQKPCDAIIATGEPFILFRYAQLLSKEFGIPWVADYRDGWSTDRINPAQSIPEKILAWHARYMEKKLIPHASMITTASPTYKKDLEQLFPGKRIEVVYNGFDDDTVQTIPFTQQDPKTFNIAYAGTIYPYQQLESFLKGFREFISESGAKNVKCTFIGLQFHPEQAKRVLSYDASLKPFLELTGKLSYRETLLRLKQASVLLLLGAKGNNTLSAKIFDYLVVQRKILFVQNDHGVLQDIMQKNNGGICCEDANDVRIALLNCYSEYQVKREVAHQPRDFEKYSRKEQAGRLVSLLTSLAK